MEVEVETRAKPLAYKVKATSRESPQQKAAHVLDTDLRNHWSTGTNTKEWILLELDEPCLLSHIRIYNKSVLEWEISAGLRYKPEMFAKVRPRCEAPRRDMMYPMSYTPCRYVRISCMRGNPIALFFVQLFGTSVPCLEPEFQPVASYLLPHIISHKQDVVDMHLQLLQDVTKRLSRFLPHIEPDLNNFSEAAESTMQFLAMLSGPCYPILYLVSESETTKLNINISDNEAPKTSQPSTAFMVSSNFEPRRSRNTPHVFLRMSRHLVFRPDAVFLLLRKAYKDSNLRSLCMMVSKILLSLEQPMAAQEENTFTSDVLSPEVGENHKSDYDPISIADYSKLFGEGFNITEDFSESDPSYVNILDATSIEEGLMHVLYASASQAPHCRKLVQHSSDFWLALPLVQALLPALRPNFSSPCQIDENLLPWKQPSVQNALSQIVATSSSVNFHPLLRACAGYLSSFSPSHAKAACVLIDLCSGILAPWMAQVIAKIELTVELLEDLIGVIQGAHRSLTRARAALIYIVLALSGNMDDIMAKYKESKHKLLFLLEMLEPFLKPALTPLKGTIAFGNVSSILVEKDEEICPIAMNVIHVAIRKSIVLPQLEAEWRRGSVAPSVLLLVLDAEMQLPPNIDERKFSSLVMVEPQSSAASPPASCNGLASQTSSNHETAVPKVDVVDVNGKTEMYEDASFLFAPPELNRVSLAHVPTSVDIKMSDSSHFDSEVENKKLAQQFPNDVALTADQGSEFYNLLADYSQLTNYRDCDLRASEFRRLAMDLNSQNEIDLETHDVAIDALLLAAECYINPWFMMSVGGISSNIGKVHPKSSFNNLERADIDIILKNKDSDMKVVADIERKRDRVVLEILIEAAEFDKKFHESTVEEAPGLNSEGHETILNLSLEDFPSADAMTLVRQNQALLCKFLVNRLWRDLHREQNPTHDILMWYLLFMLHSATKLFCGPEDVVDIILKYAEFLNVQLKMFDFSSNEGHLRPKLVKKIEIHRRWILLHKLVIASSGSDERSISSIDVKTSSRFSSLIPSLSWLQKVPVFSSSVFPLVRYFGWMAVARNANQYLAERLFLVSDLSQITYLLSIFSDDLSLAESIIEQKEMSNPIRGTFHRDISVGDEGKTLSHQEGSQAFFALYPELNRFFPNVRKDFVSFGEIILEAVGVQLKFLSPTIVPDLMCWFSDLCLWPFVKSDSDYYKGFIAKNAKAVVLYILEAIIAEHMEAMVPEMPRVSQVLVSLCRAPYCDVSFLDSVLRLLNSMIAYSLSKVPEEEKASTGDSCNNLESLCFGELFDNIKYKDKNEGAPAKIGKCQALTLFILATIFYDLSFQRKKELLISATSWAEFAEGEGMNHCHDYICAYQVLMEKCKDLFKGVLRLHGLIPLKMASSSDTDARSGEEISKSPVWFLSDACNPWPPAEVSKDHRDSDDIADATQNNSRLNLEEITSLTQDLEVLLLKLNPTIEQCWKLHPVLSKKLVLTSAESFVYLRWLSLVIEKASGDSQSGFLLPAHDSMSFARTSLERLAEMILMLQENHCWEVASVLLDSLFGLPRCFRLDNMSGEICLAVKSFSNSAPTISWRLLSDKFVSLLVARGVHNVCQNEVPLVDLFCHMLGHPEPEQRYIALKHLSALVGQNVNGGLLYISSTSDTQHHFASEPILPPLVSATWDYVALVASCDTSMPLRTHAVVLLIHFVPFVERTKLQSFLAAADSVLQCLTTLVYPKCDDPLTRFSLALIASVCLYASPEDISLIPESIWRNIEVFGMSRNDSYSSSIEQKACAALCRLGQDEEGAKQLLKEVFSSSPQKEQLPDFVTTRESILQAIGNLTSANSYFDFFSKQVEQRNTELEEAEMELELVQKEVPPKAVFDFQDWRQLPFMSTYATDDQRLQEIKDQIRSIEKAKLREEIVARRQQKLLARRAREKFLEEASLREVELVQKLDRERINETEKELERQQLLEAERAKTRELRHSLEMEKEKQAQRDLQRELEHVESGIRSSARELPSSSSSRPRDRYRERDNQGNEGSYPLPLSRTFSGQPPIILQSREKSDEGAASNNEESFEYGDTGSVGDPESISAVDGLQQSGGFGSSGLRHGSRGGKSSRQIVADRKERDGRREGGKWERKHS